MLNAPPTVPDGEVFLRLLPLRGDETVLLSGSIVEGIGTTTSDYDLVVVGPELPAKPPADARLIERSAGGRVTYFQGRLPAGPQTFGVDFYTPADIAGFGEIIRSAFTAAMTPGRPAAPPLPHSIEQLVHKVSVATSIAHREKQAFLQDTLNAAQFNFIKYCQSFATFDAFLDIAGAWQSGRIETSLDNMRELLIGQAGGLCHLDGNTNFKRKWLMENIRRLRHSNPPLVDALLRWLHADRSSPALRYRGILEACDLADLCFREARRRVKAQWPHYHRDDALPAIKKELEPQAPEWRNWEYEYWRRLFDDAFIPLQKLLEGADFVVPAGA